VGQQIDLHEKAPKFTICDLAIIESQSRLAFVRMAITEFVLVWCKIVVKLGIDHKMRIKQTDPTRNQIMPAKGDSAVAKIS
jgi:hypothetical protein